MLNKAAETSTLDAPGMKPWHLTLAFDTRALAKDKPFKGTLEEWWTPTGYRIVVTSDHYTSTEVGNADGVFRTPQTPPLPYAIDVLRSAVLHPFQGLVPPQTKFDVRSGKYGKVKIDCYTQTPRDANEQRQFEHYTLHPKYCFLPGEHEIRVLALDQEETLIFNGFGHFRDKTVGTDLSLSLAGSLGGTARITGLKSMESDEAKLQDLSGLGKVDPPPVPLPSYLFQRDLVSRPDPIYPAAAKEAHVGGTVILLVTVGKEGAVTDVQVIDSRNQDLTKASIDAVKRWHYKPLKLNGDNVSIITVVSVHFTFGGA